MMILVSFEFGINMICNVGVLVYIREDDAISMGSRSGGPPYFNVRQIYHYVAGELIILGCRGQSENDVGPAALSGRVVIYCRPISKRIFKDLEGNTHQQKDLRNYPQRYVSTVLGSNSTSVLGDKPLGHETPQLPFVEQLRPIMSCHRLS